MALSNLFFSVLLSLPTTIQLQLHANKSPVLQRRKGGKPNWIECNSVRQAGNESIMLRNGFWRAECPTWVRGVFCLQRNPGLPAYVFYDGLIKNQSTRCFIPDVSPCDARRAALQKMSRLFAFSSVIGRLEWFFRWMQICILIFVKCIHGI